MDANFRVDVDAVAAAINANTIALVGSAINFPYGTIDPIDRLGKLAKQHNVGLHVDGCLGGFFLPWAEKLGQPVPPFDFRVPGVTSMSCDTHKYGYAPKGTSVVLYRGAELRRYQYFTIADWPGGLYYSPTFSGSRPGGLSAACWAALVSMGEAGYLAATKKILAFVATMRGGHCRDSGVAPARPADRAVRLRVRLDQHLPGARPDVGPSLGAHGLAQAGRDPRQPHAAASRKPAWPSGSCAI